ncbi:hypothetical protein OpiT1DRAFT_04434 [Opitutaceae bacterium TAV1]|nr:hypothetical protein OpiT1DRAFT_04431 [Opitutaceae bacterium TAV1]EIP99901.1 hypothetical protein OpiT1DRAFT_04434 [Opitutaceae bacterium TAV1]
MADYRRLVSVITFCAAGVSTLFSQQNQKGPKENPAGPKEQFSVMLLPGQKLPAGMNLFYLPKPETPVAVTLATYGRSGPIPRAASGKLVFATQRTGTGNAPVYIPVVEAAWPGSSKRALILLAVVPASPGQSATVQALAMDDSLEEFPSNTVKILNFSGTPLLAKFGDFEGILNAGPSGIFRYPAQTLKTVESGEMAKIPFTLGVREKGETARVLYSGYVEGWPKCRTLIFALPFAPDQKERLPVRMVRDSAPASPK